MDDRLKKVLSQPTNSIEDAAWALGYSKNSGYAGVKNGTIPTIKINNGPRAKERVPTTWIRRQLGIEG